MSTGNRKQNQCFIKRRDIMEKDVVRTFFDNYDTKSTLTSTLPSTLKAVLVL